jgi:hypothetical protein
MCGEGDVSRSVMLITRRLRELWNLSVNLRSRWSHV